MAYELAMQAPIFAEKLQRGEAAGRGIGRRKVMGSVVSLTTMTDSLRSRISNPRNRVKGFTSRGRGQKWILLLLDVEEERLEPALAISSSIGSFLINSHRRTSRCNIRITFLLRTA